MHIAIQTEQEEIEQILIQHYATQHGFDLKSIQFEMNEETGKLTAVSVAEPRKEHAPPAPPPLKLDEDMVRRLLDELLNKHISSSQTSPPKPAAAAPAKEPQPAPTPAPAPKKKTKPATTALGHVVSWVDNPAEAPHHHADTPDKIEKRRAKLLRARKEAGGLLGTGDNAEEMFDPTKPPAWADTEKH